jgi:hypothetical protein
VSSPWAKADNILLT